MSDAQSRERASSDPAPTGEPAETSMQEWAGTDRVLRAGEMVGEFRIVRLVGRGGMGEVYEAEQTHPRRTVALKLIRTGLASAEGLKRFELEAEVLGRLQHPGIAQVYQAGTVQSASGSRPFFVMEFVRGEPLNEYLARAKPRTEQRLLLLARVADAVQHAHGKGVIHRDLKPANIMITGGAEDPQPKVLDFGVARLTGQDVQAVTLHTDVGQLIGTVPYMSPEQAAGDPRDLDTRSDVYALGVVGYEMLAGRLPYDLSRRLLHEAVRVIREEEPTRLSSLDRSLSGDIETILATALQKERGRRYQTAAALATDIRHYLSSEPITARPSSAWYQLSKFARRNRALVGGVVATFVVLAGGLAGVAYYAERYRDQRDEAVEARAAERVQTLRATRSLQFITRALRTGDPTRDGATNMTVVEAMERVLEDLEGGALDDEPIVSGSIRDTVGSVLFGNGEVQRAREVFEKVVADLRAAAPGSRELASALGNLSAVHLQTGQTSEAMPLLREAAGIFEGAGATDTVEYAVVRNNLGYGLQALGDLAGAEGEFEAALALQRALTPSGDSPGIAECLNNLAGVANDRRQIDRALDLYRQTLEMRRRLHGGDHPLLAQALENMSGILANAGRTDEAVGFAEEALAMVKRSVKGAHPRVVTALDRVAQMRDRQGRLDEAVAYFRESAEMSLELAGGPNPASIESMANAGALLTERGRAGEGLVLLEKARAWAVELFEPAHPLRLGVEFGVAKALLALERAGEAAAILEEQRRLAGAGGGSDARADLALVFTLARAYEGAGNVERAIESLEEAGGMAAMGSGAPPLLGEIIDLKILVLKACGLGERALLPRVLTGVQGLAAQAGATPMAARTLVEAAGVLWRHGEILAAHAVARQALGEVSDPGARARLLLVVARVQVSEGDLVGARATLVEARDHARTGGPGAARTLGEAESLLGQLSPPAAAAER